MALRSQTVTLKGGRGQHRKYRPYVFTEQGVAMLSSVLYSERAIQVSIAIMRAFVRLREMISSNKVLARRLAELEKKYDAQFRVVFKAIRELMAEPEPKSRRIGFKASENLEPILPGTGDTLPRRSTHSTVLSPSTSSSTFPSICLSALNTLVSALSLAATF
jgi:ORF6N domain